MSDASDFLNNYADHLGIVVIMSPFVLMLAFIVLGFLKRLKAMEKKRERETNTVDPDEAPELTEEFFQKRGSEPPGREHH